MRPPELDEPARRLLWIIPLAIAIWAIMLSGFSLILMRTKVMPQEETTPIEARLIEIPKEVGGLQGNGGAIHPSAPAIPKAKPIVKPHPAIHVKKIAPAPPVVRSPYGIEKNTSAPGVEEKPGASAGTAPESGESSSDTDEGGGGGIGTDTVGARAIYAPTPVIPDDLREDVIADRGGRALRRFVRRHQRGDAGEADVESAPQPGAARHAQAVEVFSGGEERRRDSVVVRSADTDFSSVEERCAIAETGTGFACAKLSEIRSSRR